MEYIMLVDVWVCSLNN